MSGSPHRLTVLSRVVLDEIVGEGGVRTVLGGSGFWAAYGAATVIDGVALASRVGADFDPFRPQLDALGISADGLIPSPCPTSRTRVSYSGDQVRHEEFVGGWSAHVRMRAYLQDLPESLRSAPGIYVFRDLPQGFWEPVLERAAAGSTLMWEIPAVVCRRGLDAEARTVLAATSILSLNAEEARDLVGEGDPATTVRRLHALGPRTIVLRRGSRGSIVSDGVELVTAGVASAAVVDPTGAGNAYSGAFLAATLRGDGLADATRVAAAVAASAIAQVGPPADADEARLSAARLAESVVVSATPLGRRQEATA